jgi:hypothetical protein
VETSGRGEGHRLKLPQLGPLIAPSIYNPVIDDVMRDLSASETEIGLSISLYIL